MTTGERDGDLGRRARACDGAGWRISPGRRRRLQLASAWSTAQRMAKEPAVAAQIAEQKAEVAAQASSAIVEKCVDGMGQGRAGRH